jgi:hypothetical protein
MKRLLVMAGLLVGLGLPQWSGAATIDDIRSANTVAIHEAMQSQLGALANDHASGAFEFATREKRSLIGSPDNFLRLVKEQYNLIYRYRRVLFSAPQLVRGNAVQVVCVTDSESHVWLAIFRMQQEQGKSWKIDGCQLLQTTSISI